MPVASSPHTTNSPVDERIQEEAALWFARLRGDEVSDYEHADFAAWLSADARHRSEYDAFQRMWDASAELRPTKPRRRQVLRTLSGLAGIALISGWVTQGWLDGQMATDSGELRHVTLADGSILDVAPETRLWVKFDTERRRIELDKGRIVVAVASDRLRPFEVATDAGVIRDIGTHFEVDVDEVRTRVSVAEGMVEIDLPSSNTPPQRVGAGEMTEFNARNISNARPVDTTALAWATGQLLFDAAPLAEVVEELNRYRKTPIRLSDPSLESIRISGVFLIDDENMALQALQQVAGVEFVAQSGKVEIRRSLEGQQ
jgi:transmembrane sensor